jgi:transcriptional regulator with XRE-family HTH domain
VSKKEKFAAYLKRRRKEKKWSLRALAKRSGIPHSNLYRMEQADADPTLSAVRKLATAFGERVPQFLEPVFAPQPKVKGEVAEG